MLLLEEIGTSPLHSRLKVRARLNAPVRGCNGGIYEPTSYFGLTYPRRGAGVTDPGPSLGLTGVVDSVVVAPSEPGGPAVSYSFYEDGVFASITVTGTTSIRTLEAILVKAARRL
jgi:hypothetical protein